MARALADLHLSSSVELLDDDENQLSMASCDTAELLRTPSPCILASDQEAVTNAELRHISAEEKPDESEQWATLSAIHKGHGGQSAADTPATSTPKKPKRSENTLCSDTEQIQEGHYEGSGYHRDGTRVGGYFLFFFF